MHRPTSEVCCCRSGGRSARCAELQLYATPVEQRHTHMILAAQDSRRSRSCTPAPQPQGPVGRHVQRRRWHQALMSSRGRDEMVCDFVRGVDRARFYPKFVLRSFFCRDDAIWMQSEFHETKMHFGQSRRSPPWAGSSFFYPARRSAHTEAAYGTLQALPGSLHESYVHLL